MSFNVALDAKSTSVKIGGSGPSDNRVKIDVAEEAAERSTAKVKLTLSVGCGAKEADLLASPIDQVKATWQANDKTANMTAVASQSAEGRAWHTGPFGITLPASIFLKDFVSDTPPGVAEITLLVQTPEGLNRWSAGQAYSIKVTKELVQRSRPTIHYFLLAPTYILHAGQTEVTVSIFATGYTCLALFRNNEEVRVWPGDDVRIAGDFRDKPSITSIYRLEGVYCKEGETVRDIVERTVQVVSSGWNQIALPQGSPVRLLVAKDFSGSKTDRLYGIYKEDSQEGRYALFSSATGVDAWRPEPGELPQHMATSPGVYHKNKLWLIGGSSVDPGNPSNEVWCYEIPPQNLSLLRELF